MIIWHEGGKQFTPIRFPQTLESHFVVRPLRNSQ